MVPNIYTIITCVIRCFLLCIGFLYRIWNVYFYLSIKQVIGKTDMNPKIQFTLVMFAWKICQLIAFRNIKID